jgi:hypothetical protein
MTAQSEGNVYSFGNRTLSNTKAAKRKRAYWAARPKEYAKHLAEQAEELRRLRREDPFYRAKTTYWSIRRRIEGRSEHDRPYYEGLPCVTKEEFLTWAMANPDYHRLFKEWQASGYDFPLAPSIDRINPAFGYEIWNMQFVTHQENARRAMMHRWHGVAAA